MSKMKIAMITDWFPPKRGGIETFTYELSSELASRDGLKVDVLTSGYPETISFGDDIEQMNGFRVRRMSGIVLPSILRYAYIHPELPYKLKSIFKEQDYDVIHTHHMFTPLPTLAAKVANSMHPRRDCVLMTNHSYNHLCESKPFKLLNYLIGKPAAPDRIIAVSEAAKKLLEEMGIDSKKVRVIPCGTNVREFHPNNRSERILDRFGLKTDILILWVGRFIKRKGLHVLLPAFKEAKREFDGKMKLAVVGRGPLEKEMKELSANLGLRGSVNFLGDVEFEELQKLYATSDFVAVPSLRNESFGLVLTEAMASGRPIIATDIEGYDEVFEEGVGFLIPPDDEKALKDSILELASDEEMRERMGKNARSLVENKYNWERIADLTLELYEDVISEI